MKLRSNGERSRRRRRARLAGVQSERYTLTEIADRDGRICGLCSEPVAMDLRCPDRGAPTIDHVVPLAAGGDDRRTNVQLAHFGCNLAKGARLQLAAS